MKNVADTLRTRPRRWPWISGGVVAAGAVVAAVMVGPSFAANLNPAPTPTSTPYVATLTPAELDSVQQGADQQAAIIAADKAAADAAAAQAVADAAAKAAKDADEGGAHTNPDGSVSGGPGCPPPYVVYPGGSCGSPICQVLADGTQVPCQ